MCQLTLFYLAGDKRVSDILSLMILNQISVNSKAGNPDGFGIYSPYNNKLFKQASPPETLYNLGGFIKELFPKQVLSVTGMAHVRKATPSLVQKLVSRENCHPFVGKRFVLMHNGSLDLVDEKNKDKKLEKLIDSAIFHSFLEKEAETTDNFKDVFNTTMNKFYGKFAFLICDKLYSKLYAAVGISADLHYTKLIFESFDKGKNNVLNGFVINTSKIELDNGLCAISSMLSATHDINISWNDSIKIEPLTANSIFDITEHIDKNEFEKPPVVLEKTKENYKTYYGGAGNFTTKNSTSVTGGEAASKNQSLLFPLNFSNPTKGKISYNAIAILDFCSRYDVDIFYVDLICYFIFKKTLVALNNDEISLFVNKALPSLEGSLSVQRKECLKYWKQIKNYCKYLPEQTIHINYEVPFPYMLSTLEEFKDIVASVRASEQEA